MNKKMLMSLIISAGIICSSVIFPNNRATATTLEGQEQVLQEAMTETIVQPMEVGSFIVTANSGANLRTGPGTNYSIIAAFPKGTVLWRIYAAPVYDVTGLAWYNVETEDEKYTGWIAGSTGYAD